MKCSINENYSGFTKYLLYNNPFRQTEGADGEKNFRDLIIYKKRAQSHSIELVK